MSTVRALGAEFPGIAYDHAGRAIDQRRAMLTLETLYSFPHRAAVLGEYASDLVQVWAMRDATDATAIPWQIFDFAIGYILGGGGILVLSHQPDVPDQVRRRLLALVRLRAREKPTDFGRDGKFVALLEACR